MSEHSPQKPTENIQENKTIRIEKRWPDEEMINALSGFGIEVDLEVPKIRGGEEEEPHCRLIFPEGTLERVTDNWRSESVRSRGFYKEEIDSITLLSRGDSWRVTLAYSTGREETVHVYSEGMDPDKE